MKRISLPAILLLTAFGFSACDSTEERRDDRKPRYGFQGEKPKEETTTQVTQTTTTTTEQEDGESATAEATPPPPPMNTGAQPGGTAEVKPQPVYGTAVPGKPGYISSPRAPYSGFIDVRGLPPGTAIKDPWAPGQMLLVP